MRLTLLAFATAVAASPFPWAVPDAVTSALPAASAPANGSSTNATRTHHRNPHKEPTPTFKLGCNCEKPVVPVDMLSETEVSERRILVDMQESDGYQEAGEGFLGAYRQLTGASRNASSTSTSTWLATTGHRVVAHCLR